MENVFNAQKGGFSIRKEFVKQSMIYAENGINMDNVNNAIKVMLHKVENVSEIRINLFLVRTVYVHNGKKEYA